MELDSSAMKTKAGLSLKHYTLKDVSGGAICLQSITVFHLYLPPSCSKDLFLKVCIILVMLVVVTSVINNSMCYAEINTSCTFVCIDNSIINFHFDRRFYACF